jgi:hypothetical protein
VIDGNLLIPRDVEHPATPTRLELVQWKPCYPALLLGYLPVVLSAVRQKLPQNVILLPNALGNPFVSDPIAIEHQ